MRSQADAQLTRWRKFRIVWAVVVTLTLAIMYGNGAWVSHNHHHLTVNTINTHHRGGAQLPMPATFASTGAIAATILIILVGVANDYTSRMLCKQAYYVGRKDYEKLGYAVGGRIWQLLVEVSVFLLLYGTMVSAIQQVGEIWYGQTWRMLYDAHGFVPTQPHITFFHILGRMLSIPCLLTQHPLGSRMAVCSWCFQCSFACHSSL